MTWLLKIEVETKADAEKAVCVVEEISSKKSSIIGTIDGKYEGATPIELIDIEYEELDED
jgi:hypothetical protein